MSRELFNKESLKISCIPGSVVGMVNGKNTLELSGVRNPVQIQYELDIPNKNLPPGTKHRGIVVPSGIASTRQNQLVQAIREHYKEDCIVLTFDYAGLEEIGGGSTGPLQLHSLGQMVSDLRSAMSIFTDNELRSLISDIILIGPSAGGNVIAAIEDSTLPISGQIFLGTPTDFYIFKRYFPHDNWDVDGYKTHISKSTGQKKRFHKNLWKKHSANLIGSIESEKIIEPMLVVGGEEDSIIKPTNLLEPNNNPKSKRIIIPGDHNFTSSRKILFNEMDTFLSTI